MLGVLLEEAPAAECFTLLSAILSNASLDVALETYHGYTATPRQGITPTGSRPEIRPIPSAFITRKHPTSAALGPGMPSLCRRLLSLVRCGVGIGDAGIAEPNSLSAAKGPEVGVAAFAPHESGRVYLG